MNAAERPYLSIVVTGRNDDFGGDFNARFFSALRFNHQCLSEAGISHEFVFVEWRPLTGKPFLATQLREHFTRFDSTQLVSYVVDPAYHEALSLNVRLQFHEFLAKNVGIRRASGSYLLVTNTDIYLSHGIVEALTARSLEPRVLYRAARHDLKSHTDFTAVDWNVLEDERNCEFVNRIAPPLYTNASGDFLLLDRESWHRLRGFNEIYRAAKIHIDSNFCVKAQSSGVRLVDIGFPVYHVGRGTLKTQKRLYRQNPGEAPWGERWNSEVVYANPPAWGLAGAPERPIDYGTAYLQFEWDVLGPMLALKRIVLPPARKEAIC